MAAINQRIPLGKRMTTPEEIANTVVFLSPRARRTYRAGYRWMAVFPDRQGAVMSVRGANVSGVDLVDSAEKIAEHQRAAHERIGRKSPGIFCAPMAALDMDLPAWHAAVYGDGGRRDFDERLLSTA